MVKSNRFFAIYNSDFPCGSYALKNDHFRNSQISNSYCFILLRKVRTFSPSFSAAWVRFPSQTVNTFIICLFSTSSIDSSALDSVDNFSFILFRRWCFRIAKMPQSQQICLDSFARFCQDNCSFNCILQFSNITRPRMYLNRLLTTFGKFYLLNAVATNMTIQKSIRQKHDIILTFPQRWYCNRKDIQSVIQVFPEISFFHFFNQILCWSLLELGLLPE